MCSDFYGTSPRPYPEVSLPDLAGEGPRTLVPTPRRLEVFSRRTAPTHRLPWKQGLSYHVPSVPGIALEPTLHAEIRRRLGGSCDRTIREASRLRFVLAGEEPDVEEALEARQLRIPDHAEGYLLLTLPAPSSGKTQATSPTPTAPGPSPGLHFFGDPEGAAIWIGSRTGRGLLRALPTAVELLASVPEGGAPPSVIIRDEPSIPLRILGGWGLCRAQRLREAVDLALRWKANRVLYNAWGWTPADRLWKEDEYLVSYARERGLELIFELRRMSFDRDRSVSDPGLRDVILGVFEQAVSAGFRSFGFLFDDVNWESAGAECDFLRRVHDTVGDRLGEVPEFFCCPQYYWYPGQMSLTWKGPADDAETSAQKRYLETYGRCLPPSVHVYLANFWASVPEDYAEELKTNYSDLIGRKPVFFDNQLINDFRLGAVFPFALRQRPPDFHENLAGYLLNTPRPLEAHAPAIATALAYAWNPAAYDANQVLGQVMASHYGPIASPVTAALRRLRELANEWSNGVMTATNHYATIWTRIRAGASRDSDLERWRHELRALREDLLGALRAKTAEVPPLVSRGVCQLIDSVQRLDSDLDLFEAYFCASEPAACPDRWVEAQAEQRFGDVSRSVCRRALSAVAEILPSLPNLEPLLEAPDGSSGEDLIERAESQGWSWVEYFYRNTRREIERVSREMCEELFEPWRST